jgi:hypothetical protein
MFAQIAVADILIQWVVVGIVVAAVIGIALIVIRQAGIQIPGWVGQVGWIVLLAVVAIVAIKFLSRLL